MDPNYSRNPYMPNPASNNLFAMNSGSCLSIVLLIVIIGIFMGSCAANGAIAFVVLVFILSSSLAMWIGNTVSGQRMLNQWGIQY